MTNDKYEKFLLNQKNARFNEQKMIDSKSASFILRHIAVWCCADSVKYQNDVT
jgi:hypothetical protein